MGIESQINVWLTMIRQVAAALLQHISRHNRHKSGKSNSENEFHKASFFKQQGIQARVQPIFQAVAICSTNNVQPSLQ